MWGICEKGRKSFTSKVTEEGSSKGKPLDRKWQEQYHPLEASLPNDAFI